MGKECGILTRQGARSGGATVREIGEAANVVISILDWYTHGKYDVQYMGRAREPMRTFCEMARAMANGRRWEMRVVE